MSRRTPCRDPRRLTVREPGPVRGSSGLERDPTRASILAARIGLVATIVVGQLWALTVALDAWQSGQKGRVMLLLAFQIVSFVVALAVWLVAPGEK